MKAAGNELKIEFVGQLENLEFVVADILRCEVGPASIIELFRKRTPANMAVGVDHDDIEIPQAVGRCQA